MNHDSDSVSDLEFNDVASGEPMLQDGQPLDPAGQNSTEGDQAQESPVGYSVR